MKKDIESKGDIKLLVNSFYGKVLKDQTIGHFFNEVAQLDFDKHMPVMYSFWETTLLGNITYKGNPMIKHIELGRKAAMRKEHFDRWLELWQETIYEYFAGEKAELAISRATQIGRLMQFKVEQDEHRMH